MDSQKQQQAIAYDNYGRMRYHPEFHPNQKKPWTTTDLHYLITNYENLGPMEISLGFGRTLHTIMNRAYQLRKHGLMAKPVTKINHKRRII